MSTFPERLRRLRESRRPLKSMTVTSQLMGMNPDALRRYERREAEPTLSALEKIADYYHVSVDYLVRGQDRDFIEKTKKNFHFST